MEFLERETQINRFASALDAAARGAGKLIAVEGEAGIGKTTLVQRFAELQHAGARIYRGGCEHLSTPEPLCPLRDIARQSRGRFAFAPGSDGLATFESLLRLLGAGPGPALLVLEDLHWADASTLDFVRYLGRRVGQLPVLALVTCRTDETRAHEQVAALWPEIPRDNVERVVLGPLSFDAVARLAAARGRRADELFAATGGNPFFVTEALAAQDDVTPATVRDATLAHMRQLSAPAVQLLEAASIFPRRVEYETLAVLSAHDDEAAVGECMRCGMLQERQGALTFRHELARRVIEESLPPRRRRLMHARALAALRERTGVGAARLAHHAEHAADVEALVQFGRQAGEEAAALGAHREASAQYLRVLSHSERLSNLERADLLERHACAAELSGESGAARSIDEASELRRRAGDTLGLGNALRIAWRIYWLAGDTARADRVATDAVKALEAHPQSWQLAHALATQSQLHMLADRSERAIEVGERAMRLAEALGRWDIYVHAWTNVASSRRWKDPERSFAELRAAIALADAHGLPDYVPRLYVNLCYMKAHERRYDDLFELLAAGIDRAAARDNMPLESYLRGVRATALLDRGAVREAIAEAREIVTLTKLAVIPRFPALTTLSRALARSGAPGAAAWLAEACTIPAADTEPQRYSVIAVADAEAHWLGEDRPQALDRLRRAYEHLAQSQGRIWMVAEVALWLHILGEAPTLPAELPRPLSSAHRLHLAGRWREAAAAWAAVGCPYEQALALREGDEAAQRAALEIFERIGAAAAAQRLRREMRAQGLRAVPSGPRAATRGNPAGLTRRQAQVLELMAAGLDNAAIGARLHISAKTAEHHVSAVLAAFGASTRQQAVQLARTQGALPAESERWGG